MNTILIHNPQEARLLLDRYFDGTISLDEEKALIRYLSMAPDLPKEMRADATLIVSLSSAVVNDASVSDASASIDDDAIPYPDGLEQRLEEHIVQLEKDRPSELSIRPRRLWLRPLVASIVLSVIVIVGGHLIGLSETSPFVDTCSTPEEAEMQMNRALSLLSSKNQESLQEVQSRTERIIKPESAVNRFIQFQ